MALKNGKITSSSLRQDGPRKSADTTLKSSLIKEIFHPRLSVDPLETSLDSTRHTCDSPTLGPSPRYSRDPISHLLVTPKRYITKLAKSLQGLQPEQSSVIRTKTSDTKASSSVVNSSCQKCSIELDQTEFGVNKVRKQDD